MRTNLGPIEFKVKGNKESTHYTKPILAVLGARIADPRIRMIIGCTPQVNPRTSFIFKTLLETAVEQASLSGCTKEASIADGS